MGPIFQWVVTHTTMKLLERTCPKCKKQQTVPLTKKKETVACRECGTPIPPKQKS